MKQILASLASLVWHLFVGADNAIANGTFGLAFESTDDVAPKRNEPIYDAATLYFSYVSQFFQRDPLEGEISDKIYRERDNTLCRHDPTFPFPLIHSDTVNSDNGDGFQREPRG